MAAPGVGACRENARSERNGVSRGTKVKTRGQVGAARREGVGPFSS